MGRLLSLLAVALAFTITSCKKEVGCTKFGSDNYNPDAIIEDGSCILARDKFLGTFNVQSDCSDNYVLEIIPTVNDSKVLILNLADSLGEIEANIYDQNITIEQQQLNQFVTVEGAGVHLAEDSVSLSFRIRDFRNGGPDIYDCFELFLKVE